MKDLNIMLAFSAGVLSFLSPCALTLMPGYLGYLTGLGVDKGEDGNNRANLVKRTLLFILGFSLVFILMGLSVTTIGKFLIRNKLLFSKIGGILIIIFGIHTMGLFKFKLFNKQKKAININWRKRSFNPFILGVAFSVGWTPCIGPILSSILIYAGSSENIFRGFVLLLFYSMGFAVPFLLAAFLMEKASKSMIRLRKYSKIISIISGILLITMGVLMYTNKLVYLNSLFN